MGEQVCAIHIFFQSVYRRLWKSVSWLLWEITFLTILGKEELPPSWELHKEFLLSHPVTSWEFFRRSCQGLKSGCPCVTPHVPGGSSPELELICMCFTPALFFLTSPPHSVDRRQLPQSSWGTVRDSGVLSDLPRVALSSSSQGRGCVVPPDAGGRGVPWASGPSSLLVRGKRRMMNTSLLLWRSVRSTCSTSCDKACPLSWISAPWQGVGSQIRGCPN